MLKLIQGVRDFQSKVFPTQSRLFARLAQGQHPEALFITCSDSRIDPNLITNTDPGEIFVLRNIGNIVPPSSAEGDSEEAVIEYALENLGIKNIIICGHSNCGAMIGLLHPEKLAAVPSVASWLAYAAETMQVVGQRHAQLYGDALLAAVVQENVLVQLGHLQTLPSVSSRLTRGEVQLHGWYYEIETGEVRVLDPATRRFVPFAESYKVTV